MSHRLIVVFNARFEGRHSPSEQAIPLAATMLVALVPAMLIAPAACHRWVEPDAESRRIAFLAARLPCWSLLPASSARFTGLSSA